ncbi:hypothetical protein BpHYR1_053486 [Brachionus plicatilis]|uniref:Uncharacterized protein n=1 Tax=Brachionus plicatilis TaxID=10195 RepID=A0A3M7R3E8_BRAPC|nr:hypothetical protein BpHYR1_053486 [Brachionus plicatilis]
MAETKPENFFKSKETNYNCLSVLSSKNNFLIQIALNNNSVFSLLQRFYQVPEFSIKLNFINENRIKSFKALICD